MTDARLQVGQSQSALGTAAVQGAPCLQATTHALALQAHQQVHAWTEADPAFEAAAEENIDMFCFETSLKVKGQAVQRSTCSLAHDSCHECSIWHPALI